MKSDIVTYLLGVFVGVVLAAILSGIFYPDRTVHVNTIRQAVVVCVDNNSVDKIKLGNRFSNARAYCINGAEFTLTEENDGDD